MRIKAPNARTTKKLMFIAPVALGGLAIVWVATLFIGTNALALLVTLLIVSAFALGVAELVNFRRATHSLQRALGNVPHPMNALEDWLAGVHTTLQNPVRLRIESERVGLPAPVLTPYLVGLLVMLGLLGTFIGMVNTLGGAVTALEGSTELQAIRQGLAAPINGLSLAFGTSVAGVAASAMLGLLSTLCRRERMLVTRTLDATIATTLRPFSLAHSRQQTYNALQAQANALPALTEQMQKMTEQIGQLGNTLGEQLLASQNSFQGTVETRFNKLATSVDESLGKTLSESSRQTGNQLITLASDSLLAMATETRNTQQHLTATTQEQLEGHARQFASTTEKVNAAGQQLLENFGSASATWLQRAQASDTERLTQWQNSLGQLQEQLATQLMNNFNTLRDELTDMAKGQQNSSEKIEQLSETVAGHVAQLGKELEEPMTRLIETSNSKDQATAELFTQLRSEMGNNVERDNALLDERKTLMQQMENLSQSLQAASGQQQESVAQLVASSTGVLEQAGVRFSTIADHFESSATEMNSLGEAFGAAVEQYSEANTHLVQQLNRIEQAMDAAGNRSDQQMGYYVSQAREIIDQSLLSQKEMFDELRLLTDGEELSGSEEDKAVALN